MKDEEPFLDTNKLPTDPAPVTSRPNAEQILKNQVKIWIFDQRAILQPKHAIAFKNGFKQQLAYLRGALAVLDQLEKDMKLNEVEQEVNAS